MSLNRVIIALTAAAAVLWGTLTTGSPAAAATDNNTPNARVTRVVFDNFDREPNEDNDAPKWTLTTDRNVAGVSRGDFEYETADKRTCLHLKGLVSTAEGGYLQLRVNLGPRGREIDGRRVDGIYLQLKAEPGTYLARLGTAHSRFAWQYYQASLKTTGRWQEVRLPFKGFIGPISGPPMDVRRLKSFALVAVASGFKADILIDEIGYYKEQKMQKELTPAEQRVIVGKGTEPPFTGKYVDHFVPGTYTCKRCGAELFKSDSKFHSGCGWPSFDEQIPGAVKWQPDADGARTEIICNACGGHLGHVFKGEQLTPKNVRYCVNSISMDFIPAEPNEADATERAILASGCFWGTEYHLQRLAGVISTTVGYTGGHVENPTYKQVCTDTTGHAEAVEVVFDPAKVSYEQLLKLYFETHDFTQLDRQGPDIGKQYRSEVFYTSEQQKQIAEKLIAELRSKGFDVKTRVTEASKFWPAEDYHQDYYERTAKVPYCHRYRKIF